MIGTLQSLKSDYGCSWKISWCCACQVSSFEAPLVDTFFVVCEYFHKWPKRRWQRSFLDWLSTGPKCQAAWLDDPFSTFWEIRVSVFWAEYVRKAETFRHWRKRLNLTRHRKPHQVETALSCAAWPFPVGGVICLVNSVSVCERKERRRREKKREKEKEKKREEEEKKRREEEKSRLIAG